MALSERVLAAGVKAAVKTTKQVVKKPSNVDLASAEKRLAMYEATRARLMQIKDTKRTAEEAAELAKAIKLKDIYTVHVRSLKTQKAGGVPHTLQNQGM